MNLTNKASCAPSSVFSFSGQTTCTHILTLPGQQLGGGRQSGFDPRVDAINGHRDHLALLGGKLGEDLGLKAAQHQALLQQQLQLPEVGGAGVIPPPSVLGRRRERSQETDKENKTACGLKGKKKYISLVTSVKSPAALRVYREAEATLGKFHGDKVEFYRPTKIAQDLQNESSGLN